MYMFLSRSSCLGIDFSRQYSRLVGVCFRWFLDSKIKNDVSLRFKFVAKIRIILWITVKESSYFCLFNKKGWPWPRWRGSYDEIKTIKLFYKTISSARGQRDGESGVLRSQNRTLLLFGVVFATSENESAAFVHRKHRFLWSKAPLSIVESGALLMRW